MILSPYHTYRSCSIFSAYLVKKIYVSGHRGSSLDPWSLHFFYWIRLLMFALLTLLEIINTNATRTNICSEGHQSQCCGFTTDLQRHITLAAMRWLKQGVELHFYHLPSSTTWLNPNIMDGTRSLTTALCFAVTANLTGGCGVIETTLQLQAKHLAHGRTHISVRNSPSN